MMVGGAVGIAAAFNTPLAGVMFAIEELSRQSGHRSNGLLLAAVCSGLAGGLFARLVVVSLSGRIPGRVPISLGSVYHPSNYFIFNSCLRFIHKG